MEECCVQDACPEACISERQNSIGSGGRNKTSIHCTDDSLAGSVSQRACVFCGSRVVLYPIADALHVYSAARYNDGSEASTVTLAPMDGIVLARDPVRPSRRRDR